MKDTKPNKPREAVERDKLGTACPARRGSRVSRNAFYNVLSARFEPVSRYVASQQITLTIITLSCQPEPVHATYMTDSTQHPAGVDGEERTFTHLPDWVARVDFGMRCLSPVTYLTDFRQVRAEFQ